MNELTLNAEVMFHAVVVKQCIDANGKNIVNFSEESFSSHCRSHVNHIYRPTYTLVV